VTPESSHLQLIDTKSVLVDGPFKGTDTSDAAEWLKKTEEWTELHVVGELTHLRENLGKPTTTWRTTLPTQGVYADLSLGRCSGAEDYIEITRQYDLEIKRLEIKRLELETERLRVENEGLAGGKPNVLVTTNADATTVNLEVATANAASHLEVRKTDG
jgi:hypothetical protein